MKAIFAHSGVDFWINVASRLHQEHGWEIPYVIGSDAMEAEVHQKLPGAVFHPNSRANQALPPENGPSITPALLDEAILKPMAPYETVFLKMMDRLDYSGDLTHGKRQFLYHRQAAYWKGVLDHFAPDIVAFRIAPHMGHDYVLYGLCRVLGVKTFMFERTAVPGLVYPVGAFEDGSPRLSDLVRKIPGKGRKKITLSQETEQHLARLAKSYDQALPLHLRYKMQHVKKGGALEGIGGVALSMGKSVARSLLRHPETGALKGDLHKNLGSLKKKKLHDHYGKLAKSVDFARPYVFAALQCEPERQTCPCGGVFGNQYLMIEALSRSVPPGWMIYVKEHVSQFKSYQNAERSRTKAYYDYLASMENVRLVPLDVTSFDLIDNAMASATVSGTVAWESVVRGKPALLFGYAWHRDCPGIFVTHSIELLKNSLEKIENGFKPEPRQIRAFLAAVEEVSIRAYIDKLYAKLGLVDSENNVANLARCINDFFRKK